MISLFHSWAENVPLCKKRNTSSWCWLSFILLRRLAANKDLFMGFESLFSLIHDIISRRGQLPLLWSHFLNWSLTLALHSSIHLHAHKIRNQGLLKVLFITSHLINTVPQNYEDFIFMRVVGSRFLWRLEAASDDDAATLDGDADDRRFLGFQFRSLEGPVENKNRESCSHFNLLWGMASTDLEVKGSNPTRWAFFSFLLIFSVVLPYTSCSCKCNTYMKKIS